MDDMDPDRHLFDRGDPDDWKKDDIGIDHLMMEVSAWRDDFMTHHDDSFHYDYLGTSVMFHE